MAKYCSMSYKAAGDSERWIRTGSCKEFWACLGKAEQNQVPRPVLGGRGRP